MEKDSDARGGTRRREGGTKETPDPGSRKYVEERKKPPCGSYLTHHTHLSEWAESGRWVENTRPIYIYIYVCLSWNGYITRADWHISASVFSIFLLSGSLTPTLRHRHTLSLSHAFIHSCSPPSRPLESGAMYQTPITTHSLSCLPATHTHAGTHRHTDRCLFFFSPFLLVHSFLSFIFVRNGDNL